jgi:hypothetical protein
MALAFDHLWCFRLAKQRHHILLYNSLGICPVIDLLYLNPEISPHFFTALLRLETSILHQITCVLQMPLDYNLDIFLALIQGRRSLQLFVLFLEQEIKFVLLRLDKVLNFLISFLLELDPFIRRLHCEELPHSFVVFSFRASC